MLRKNTLLFSVGPIEMKKEVLELNNGGLPYFRTKEFSELMVSIEEKILKIANAPYDSKMVILTASGSAGMEASIINSFNHDSKVLVVNGGSFGERFVKILEVYNIKYEEVILKKGEILTEEKLSKFKNKGFTGFVINAHETSTGVLYDLKIVSKFCKEENLFLVVDAISSFIADEYDMKQLGVNITILSSQKALGISPGLSILLMDSKAVNLIKSNNPKTLYLDLKDYLSNMERGQTPFTPDVGAINELSYVCDEIIKNGLDKEREKIIRIANDFRKKIKKLPLEIFSERLSNAVTSIIVKEKNISAYELYERLRKNHNITVLPSGGELKDLVFRVGHIGNLKVEDNDRLVEALKIELERGI